MKTGGPSPSPNTASVQRTPNGPAETRIDLTRTEPSASFNTDREHSDRQRRANPEFQDGSYGFEAKQDKMEVDTEVLGANNSATDNARNDYSRPRNDRRENRDRDRRDDRRDARYDAPRDGGRGRSYLDRDRESGRDYRLHSDNMYPRPRGRGFR